MKAFYFVLFLLIPIIHTQAQWTWQNPLPQGNTLNSVKFVSTSEGWAVGELGTILKTTDGGQNWAIQTSGIGSQLYGVSFTDENNGWAVGGEIVPGDIILRTINGGLDWIQQTSEPVFPGVVFTDANNRTMVSEFGTIFRIKNGGTEWTFQSNGKTYTHLGISLTDIDSGTTVDLNDVALDTIKDEIHWVLQTNGIENSIWGVSFTDANNGTIVRGDVSVGGIIIRTTNGGKDWVEQASGPVLTSVCFADVNNGIAVGYNGAILRTTNGGTIWTSQTSGTTASLYSASFTDLNNGTVVGSSGTILRTTNGGTTWTSQTSGTTNWLWCVHFINANSGWAAGQIGTILRTTNGGTTWTSQTSGTTALLYSVSSTDVNNGWVVGSSGTILRTTNGGTIWTSQTSGTTYSLNGVSFTDANTGTAVGDVGMIVRTTNGGTIWTSQWTSQLSGTNPWLYSISFTDENKGTVVGSSGTILRTTNGGTTWTSQTSGTTNSLYSVFFTDENNGWIAGYAGTILRTTNGGIDWVQQTSGTTTWFLEVFFIDENTGWVVGLSGTILRTTNGGATWTSLTSGTTIILTSVFFTDANNGTAVGGCGSGCNGTILRTTNGGTTWTLQTSGTTNYLKSVFFTDENNGWTIGDPGAILRTTDGSINWNPQTSGTTTYLEGVYFIDANIGWVVGLGGTILRTTKGGTTWTSQTSRTTSYLKSVFFTDANSGWAVGNLGSILKYSVEPVPVPLPVWSNQIIVEDAAGTESSKILTIGQNRDATDSIDFSLGEFELPPPPANGTFDARLNLPTNPVVSSLKDYRDSSVTQITWTITFQPGSSGYPMRVSWDSTAFPEGTFYLKDRINGSFVNVNMKKQNSYTLVEPSITSLDIRYTGIFSSVLVNNEWNMISVPLLAEDMSLSNLFPTATSLAYGFDGGYVTEDTLVDGKGYWLKFSGNEQIQICGSVLGDSVSVKQGWNIFGSYEAEIPISQITTTPPGIIATYFFGFNDGYYIADTLKSGQGYWVRVTQDGVINLSFSGLIKAGVQEQFAAIDNNWGKIKIIDNRGKSITLYAVEEEVESNFYDLPPMPPTGIFDSRYSSGRLVENLSSEKTIMINSDNYPITIRAEGINLTIRDRINGEILNEELKSGEELRITNNKITSIKVTGNITGELPVSYELYQNYPNPFNPSTTIKFAVPKESNVNLSIYNVLGELVSILVNEEMKPGYYEDKFDASSLASGVYIYRIKAGDFLQTKKMVLLK